ncbi:hypothetical protein NKH77_25885 [Streptomyces sp. M19]
MGEYLNIGPNSMAFSHAAQRVMRASGLPRRSCPARSRSSTSSSTASPRSRAGTSPAAGPWASARTSSSTT